MREPRFAITIRINGEDYIAMMRCRTELTELEFLPAGAKDADRHLMMEHEGAFSRSGPPNTGDSRRGMDRD